MLRRLLLLLFVALLGGGCATTPPVDLGGADPNLTPNRAFADPEAARGQRAAWGGTIVNTRNLKSATEIEVLGYPLDDARPDLGANPQRRFLIVKEGYLEPADYRSGRLITAVGPIQGTRDGTVGEASYTYPVLQADQLYLWPIGENPRSEPNIHFGIGLGVIIR